MHKKGKTVRKCYDCILNLGDHCAVYEEPHDRWHHSKCSSYNDKELYNEYLENQKKHPVDQAKELRKEKAKKVHTAEHRQGRKSP
ncbi:MAG: hypothetical protein MRK01_00565 [Candidatus Scalindua sp.]|nr:hypothetical protein [Candidatus Scalindua sp.]